MNLAENNKTKMIKMLKLSVVRVISPFALGKDPVDLTYEI